ncbi:DUF4177 domain-containing protein [Miniphocaeibacter massiliensis]|uniref:DUF4177 domain-containing protein n=1 Tax=Miniphocaeibacter massiliensis TaxID=2041841 RepID=UPI000C1C1B1C|nr:DUF4177 domain-containing protein [Miniphocaeibacter massiliensis]
MKEYKFVEVEFTGLVKSTLYAHREIIEEYAKKGYTYINAIPTELVGYGSIKKMDLVFEIEK